MRTGIRYFEITEMIGLLPMIICEYTDDFGWWISKTRPYRIEIKVGTELWIFSSVLFITKGTAEKSCVMLQSGTMNRTVVDLKSVSNPKSKRLPAMRKKAK